VKYDLVADPLERWRDGTVRTMRVVTTFTSGEGLPPRSKAVR
jgi:hypothetical protein